MKKLFDFLGTAGVCTISLLLSIIARLMSVLIGEELVFYITTSLIIVLSGFVLVTWERYQKASQEQMKNEIIDMISMSQTKILTETAAYKDIICAKLDEVISETITQKEMVCELSSAISNTENNIEDFIKVNLEIPINNIREGYLVLKDQNDMANKSVINEIQMIKDYLNKNMENVIQSLDDAEGSHCYMEERMYNLELQNFHLQMLTTMISTVRSDIATINEVKGFVDEAKIGRKIRIVRDDEHKVVVENLMNSDGIRIEKSKMYRNNLLAFEAEFDEFGKMKSSKNYDKDGELSTVVSYEPDNGGRPKLINMAKEKIGKFVNNLNR